MENLRGFKVKYHGPTDTRGSRVSITDTRHNQKVTIPYDYKLNSAYDMAEVWLKEKGIECKWLTDDGAILLTDDFATKIK